MIGDGVRRSGNIKFIGVGRAVDRVLVASLMVNKLDSPEQYHTAVREVMSAPDFSNKVSHGARYRLVGDVNAFNFTTDPEHRLYFVISSFDYPERLVFPMINEMVMRFKSEFGSASLTCAAGALDSKTKRMFQQLAEEYEDPTKKDKLAQVQAQVQDVKLTMHKNLDSMLKNIDKATDIEEGAKKLKDQASKFETQAKVLKKRELCRKYKTTACIVLSIAIIITIAILAFIGPGAATAGGGGYVAPPTPPPTAGPTNIP